MAYIDSFILPIAIKDIDAYKKASRIMGKIYIEHGALEYKEWLAEDVKPGKWTSFPQAVKLKEGETVVVSYVVYKSRAQRDKINKLAMADPRMQPLMEKGAMPIDGKRMILGGFAPLVSMDA